MFSALRDYALGNEVNELLKKFKHLIKSGVHARLHHHNLYFKLTNLFTMLFSFRIISAHIFVKVSFMM
jgi:hypothetical protein